MFTGINPVGETVCDNIAAVFVKGHNGDSARKQP